MCKQYSHNIDQQYDILNILKAYNFKEFISINNRFMKIVSMNFTRLHILCHCQDLLLVIVLCSLYPSYGIHRVMTRCLYCVPTSWNTLCHDMLLLVCTNIMEHTVSWHAACTVYRYIVHVVSWHAACTVYQHYGTHCAMTCCLHCVPTLWNTLCHHMLLVPCTTISYTLCHDMLLVAYTTIAYTLCHDVLLAPCTTISYTLCHELLLVACSTISYIVCYDMLLVPCTTISYKLCHDLLVARIRGLDVKGGDDVWNVLIKVLRTLTSLDFSTVERLRLSHWDRFSCGRKKTFNLLMSNEVVQGWIQYDIKATLTKIIL